VVQGVYQGVTTVELDNLAAETAAYLTTKHPDYAVLAARIAISNLHKETKKNFSQVVKDLYNYVNPKNGRPAGMISEDTYKVVCEHAEALDSAIIYNRDFTYNYFGFKTLERSYLLRINGRVAERPQHMIMRVAVGIHGADLDRVIETYNLMSERYFTHASPTLFNAGTPHPQLSSCFLVCMKDDSIDGIYDTLKNCAMISKTAGGIGLSIHCIRATGSYIAGTNGTPMVSYRCSVLMMPPQDTSIKVAISVLAPSLSTSSRGMPISSNSSTLGKTTARKKLVLEISFMLCGFLTYS